MRVLCVCVLCWQVCNWKHFESVEVICKMNECGFASSARATFIALLLNSQSDTTKPALDQTFSKATHIKNQTENEIYGLVCAREGASLVAVNILVVWRVCIHILSRLHFMRWPYCAAVAAILAESCIFQIAKAKRVQMKCNEFYRLWNKCNTLQANKQTHIGMNKYFEFLTTLVFQHKMYAILTNVHTLGNSSLSLRPG